MWNQGYNHPADEDSEPQNQFMSSFSFDVMTATSTFPNESYFKDSKGVTYRVQKVEDGSTPQEVSSNPPRHAAIQTANVPQGVSNQHSDHRRPSVSSQSVLQSPPSPESTLEDYRHLVSANFASYDYRPDYGRSSGEFQHQQQQQQHQRQRNQSNPVSEYELSRDMDHMSISTHTHTHDHHDYNHQNEYQRHRYRHSHGLQSPDVAQGASSRRYQQQVQEQQRQSQYMSYEPRHNNVSELTLTQGSTFIASPTMASQSSVLESYPPAPRRMPHDRSTIDSSIHYSVPNFDPSIRHRHSQTHSSSQEHYYDDHRRQFQEHHSQLHNANSSSSLPQSHHPPYSPDTAQSSNFQDLPFETRRGSGLELSHTESAPTEVSSQVSGHWPQYSQRAHRTNVVSHDSDGMIPVVETGGYPPGQPYDTMYPIPLNHRQGSLSSGSSSIRESVAPGEELIYESPYKALALSAKVGSEYKEGALRVFHDEGRKQIRVYVNIGSYSESQTVREKGGVLIPYYAYSPHGTNVISIHDNSNGKGAKSGPIWLLKFTSTDNLLDFQGRLTGEDVVLDISSIRSLKMQRNRSSTKETFSGSLRVQLWHEPRSKLRLEGSGGSVMSNGTVLAGPLREKTTLSSSKLVVFLGRTEGFFMCYITDEIELTKDANDPCTINLKARQYDLALMRRSRSGVMGKIHERKGTQAASLKLVGRAINPDEQDDFATYRVVTLEFERETNQLQFTEQWNKLLRARRAQRQEISQIKDQMARQGLGARDALKIRT
ncbi:hypothetical protein BROUX41_004891 [Berkeleyomyces rouxiae]|uniref:uncharacterized protein n=1 Tax=Berkeleyomyces rouxiae TaxID=2035830 RepID=UPI003B7D5D48